MDNESGKDINSKENYFEICERCKSNAKGNRYTFYYGKTAGKRTEGTGNGIKITQLYSDTKSESIFLCDNCVSAASRSLNIGCSIGYLILAVFTTLFTGGMIYEKVRGDDTVPTCLLPVLGIFALTFIVSTIQSIIKAKTGFIEQTSGEQMAISIRSSALKLLGYDTFWTTDAYKNLSIDITRIR